MKVAKMKKYRQFGNKMALYRMAQEMICPIKNQKISGQTEEEKQL